VKVRSVEELESALDNDFVWRRREFTTIKLLISGARKHEKMVLIRAGIALLYSHWEGHVKLASEIYIGYLNSLAYNYSDMKPNFIQLSLADKFSKGFSLKKFSSRKDICEYLTNGHSQPFKIDEKKVVDTESNLKSKVLFNIMEQLGLDTQPFILKENFIDSVLLNNRNKIAHGEKVNENALEDAYAELEAELMQMILTFQNLIRNAASNKEYLVQV
jgi:RiboL-PSP-HEPN